MGHFRVGRELLQKPAVRWQQPCRAAQLLTVTLKPGPDIFRRLQIQAGSVSARFKPVRVRMARLEIGPVVTKLTSVKTLFRK